MTSKKALVVKDNRLIEASYRLDLSEQRLILLAIVQARIVKPITSDTLIEITASDYAAACALDTKSSYQRLKEASDNLFQRWVQLRGVDVLTGKEALLKTRWVSSCIYVENAGLVRLRISPDIIPYISELEANFTSYQLKNVAQMTSTYAIRLYELLAQYKKIGNRYFELSEFKRLLDADEKSYERIDNLRKKVLDIAVNQVNELTDIHVTYTDRKAGRAVIGFDFNIEKKTATPTNPPLPKKREIDRRIDKVEIGLSTAEKNMLRQLAAKTGKTEAELLDDARQKGGDLFLTLDQMARAGV